MALLKHLRVAACMALLLGLRVATDDAPLVDGDGDVTSLCLLQMSAHVYGNDGGIAGDALRGSAESNLTKTTREVVLTRPSPVRNASVSFISLALADEAKRLAVLLHRGDAFLSQGISGGSIAAIVLGVLALVCMISCCSYHRASHLIGDTVAGAIEAWDKDIFGVDVSIGSLGVAPWTGAVDIRNFMMHNAPGYSAPYLVKARRVLVDIDIWRYMTSGGKDLVVQELKAVDVSIIYEKSLYSSNVDWVQNFLESSPSDQDDAASDQAAEGCGARMLQCTRDAKAQALRCTREARSTVRRLGDLKEGSKKHRVEVHKVQICDVGVILEAKGHPNHGIPMSVPNLHFNDLYRKAGSSVPLMVKAVLKEVLSNTAKTASSNLWSIGGLGSQSSVKSGSQSSVKS